MEGAAERKQVCRVKGREKQWKECGRGREMETQKGERERLSAIV